MNRGHRILISNRRIALPAAGAPPSPATVATLVANIAYFGFALSAEAYAALGRASDAELGAWWRDIEEVLAALTGDDKQMASFVVYKNFPAEVLAMDEVEYWTRQILMYWGLPNELVTQAEKPRERLGEPPEFRVLHLATPTALSEICAGLFALPARWIDDQWLDVQFLVGALDRQVELDAIPFVENRIRLAAYLIERGATPSLTIASDVLRLAAALSGGDISLREPTRLRKLARRERRALLAMLESAKQLDEDVARRREAFKRLLHKLHPGDYRTDCPRVVAVYDKLYTSARIPRFSAELEQRIAARDTGALELLRTRPGELARRLHAMLLAFGPEAARAFTAVVDRLTTIQLVRLHRYFSTVDGRRWRTFPPRGNWTKLQIVDMPKGRKLPRALRGDLLGAIRGEIARRLAHVGPVALSPKVACVKLQTSDSELAPYGRGTSFPIPPRIRFVRTASYWSTGPTRSNLWFDNGWNFFSAEWKSLGACCWNAAAFGKGAVFSGDPTSSKDLEGRACQLIDLYLDELAKAGVAYAVWTVLCYSRIPFSAAKEVFAALQWGEKPQAGKLFEPSRCQLAFPLAGESFTKFVALVDLGRREVVYLDANLHASTTSAAVNGKLLEKNMPAFVEYLDSLPSVYDLFDHLPKAADGMPVLYDDAAGGLSGGRRAYVFAPRNQDSAFTPVDPSTLL
ncbi:MAG TPA: hypothetical protein VGD80_21010 [Kofleriaceae bacterium]